MAGKYANKRNARKIAGLILTKVTWLRPLCQMPQPTVSQMQQVCHKALQNRGLLHGARQQGLPILLAEPAMKNASLSGFCPVFSACRKTAWIVGAALMHDMNMSAATSLMRAAKTRYNNRLAQAASILAPKHSMNRGCLPQIAEHP